MKRVVMFHVELSLHFVSRGQTRAKSPQTNGVCERFHCTIQDEFYAIVFRKKRFTSIEALQQEPDTWIKWYHEERTHSGKHGYGKTPWDTFIQSKHLALEKQVAALPWRTGEARSTDKPLISNQSEGWAKNRDSSEAQNQSQSIGQ